MIAPSSKIINKMADKDLAVKFFEIMQHTESSDERIKSFIQYLNDITPEFQGDDELRYEKMSWHLLAS